MVEIVLKRPQRNSERAVALRAVVAVVRSGAKSEAVQVRVAMMCFVSFVSERERVKK